MPIPGNFLRERLLRFTWDARTGFGAGQPLLPRNSPAVREAVEPRRVMAPVSGRRKTTGPGPRERMLVSTPPCPVLFPTWFSSRRPTSSWLPRHRCRVLPRSRLIAGRKGLTPAWYLLPITCIRTIVRNQPAPPCRDGVPNSDTRPYVTVIPFFCGCRNFFRPGKRDGPCLNPNDPAASGLACSAGPAFPAFPPEKVSEGFSFLRRPSSAWWEE